MTGGSGDAVIHKGINTNETIYMIRHAEAHPGYFPDGGGPTAPSWPENDYGTIWTVTLDATGNVTVDNAKYQGIESASLPAACPQF